MSVTALQIFEHTMALMDELNDDGTVADNTADYRARSPRIINVLQNELMPVGDLYKTHEISNSYIENQLGEHFDIIEHEDSDLIYEAIGSKAYYFEVDGEATVYVEEEIAGVWTALTTVSAPNTVTSFTAYKGSLTPSSTSNKVRLRFSGTKYYRTNNRALFAYSFNTVPDYRPWIKKQMPTDFKSIDQIIAEYPDKQYVINNDYKWEGKRDLYINYSYNGSLRIIYKPILTPITTINDTLEIDDMTAYNILPWGLGQALLATENPSLSDFMGQKYDEAKRSQSPEVPASEQPIEDKYGGIKG